MQIDIIDAIAEADIYDWIKVNHFKGSFKDARMAIGQEKYYMTIDQEVLKDGIVINSFKK